MGRAANSAWKIQLVESKMDRYYVVGMARSISAGRTFVCELWIETSGQILK